MSKYKRQAISIETSTGRQGVRWLRLPDFQKIGK
jgi:hypothetical protein